MSQSCSSSRNEALELAPSSDEDITEIVSVATPTRDNVFHHQTEKLASVKHVHGEARTSFWRAASVGFLACF